MKLIYEWRQLYRTFPIILQKNPLEFIRIYCDMFDILSWITLSLFCFNLIFHAVGHQNVAIVLALYATFTFQENLLNDNSGEPLVLRPYNYFLSSYVIRLDTISALNPNVRTNGNLLKPFDPPPSYEEVCYSIYRKELYLMLFLSCHSCLKFM